MSKFNSNIRWPREVLCGLGDLGTLVPYLLGYILVVGLPAQQVFGVMGFLLIGAGALYRLPMPVHRASETGDAAPGHYWMLPSPGCRPVRLDGVLYA